MKEVAIVGAGIGGLTAAHALRKAGYGVRVFERAEALRAVGAGITMQANAMAALESLGLARAVRELGQPIGEGEVTDWKGKLINRLDVRVLANVVGHVGVGIHRGRLVEALASGLQDSLVFDAPVKLATNVDDGAVLELIDGRRLKFDAIVGADGLHSVVRKSLAGDEPLRYAGYTTWRGIARMSAHDVGLAELWGPGRRFGFVPIADDEIYWFAVDDAPAGQAPTEPILDEVRPLFVDWDERVLNVLAHTDPTTVLRTDSFDRPPTKLWGKGRITLLGDAAHPMTPNLGQGGGQAVESAVVLGRVMAKATAIEEGLRRYESLRQERANHFVNQSWNLGRMAQWSNPLARGMRDLALRLTPNATAQKMVTELYDFEGWYASLQKREA